MFLLMFRKVTDQLLLLKVAGQICFVAVHASSSHLSPVFVPQRHLGDAAKKAIGKLTTRTVKKGDKVGLCHLLRLSFLPRQNV